MSILYNLFGKILFVIYSVVGSYGLAIIIFSILAKVLQYPLTKKQMESSRIMKAMGPELDEIKKKYKTNKNKMNEAMFKLYDKYNYSPTSGCLPLLIQFPIIIGLFTVIREPAKYVFSAAQFANVDMSFLWIPDLSHTAISVIKASGLGSMESILALILPLLTVFLTYYQQVVNAANGPTQPGMKGMTIFMTVFVGYASLTFSAGLSLYWIFQTGLTILQNVLVVGAVDKQLLNDDKKGGKKATATSNVKGKNNQQKINQKNSSSKTSGKTKTEKSNSSANKNTKKNTHTGTKNNQKKAVEDKSAETVTEPENSSKSKSKK